MLGAEYLRLKEHFYQFNLFAMENKTSLSKHKFLVSLSVNTGKSIEFFEEIIFLYFEVIKEEKEYEKEQHYLIIIDRFKGQGNEILIDLCFKRNR